MNKIMKSHFKLLLVTVVLLQCAKEADSRGKTYEDLEQLMKNNNIKGLPQPSNNDNKPDTPPSAVTTAPVYS